MSHTHNMHVHHFLSNALSCLYCVTVISSFLFKVILLFVLCLCVSWCDWCSAHWDLQPDSSACSLHDRWFHDVAQPFHHWNDLSISGGQSVSPSIHTPPISIHSSTCQHLPTNVLTITKHIFAFVTCVPKLHPQSEYKLIDRIYR